MKIVVSGATGFIGRPLVTQLLSAGHQVTALVRDPIGASGLSCKRIHWDGGATRTDPGILADVDTVIHLAGSPVGESRWSSEVKRKIRDSRVLGTRSLVEAIGALDPAKRPRISSLHRLSDFMAIAARRFLHGKIRARLGIPCGRRQRLGSRSFTRGLARGSFRRDALRSRSGTRRRCAG